MKTLVTSFLAAVIFVALSGCGSPKVELNVYQKESRYPQNFTAHEALFVRERNGAPNTLASAFLVDRQKGRFASAKHFVGSESDGRCKIFFNGKVYDGFLVKLPPITDLAVIQIQGDFNQASFPEPYKIAQNIKVGTKVFVRGIHPHPRQLQKNKIVIPIFREYFGIERYEMIGLESKLVFEPGSEFIYDDLEGKITKLNVPIRNKEIGGSSEILAEASNIYIELNTKENHRFSFGGLSGGPTVNERNELVGINSNEVGAYLELTDKGITYHPWITFHLVPASELEKLMSQLTDIK